MIIKHFEEILSWKKAQDLAFDIYKSFGNCTDYKFKGQICSAAISVSNNIAEGFERGSDADFARFLYISKGSCGEVRSMLYLAVRLDYIKAEQASILQQNATEISKLISNFIKHLKK
jgi:four helix bundle protein